MYTKTTQCSLTLFAIFILFLLSCSEKSTDLPISAAKKQPIEASLTSQANITFLPKEQVNKNVEEDLKIYNNTSSNNITIVYHATEAGKGNLNIYFIDGRILSHKEVSILAGTNTWRYDFPRNATGFFVVEFATKNTVRTEKVLITLP